MEIGRLAARDLFGEMGILETLGRSASVVTVTDTTCFSLPSAALYRLHLALPSDHGILRLIGCSGADQQI